MIKNLTMTDWLFETVPSNWPNNADAFCVMWSHRGVEDLSAESLADSYVLTGLFHSSYPRSLDVQIYLPKEETGLTEKQKAVFQRFFEEPEKVAKNA